MSDASLTYCTNIWSHYQGAFGRELVRLLGDARFRLCLFEPFNEERRILGWADARPDYGWLAGPPRSSSDMERLRGLVCDADVAVLGACPQDIEAARISTGKLTFMMGERLWKQPFARWRMLNPRYARGVRRYKRIANRPNVHYLAVGAYAGEDARRIGAFGDRLWTWAYFADVPNQPPQPRTNGQIRVLWVGRMLKWKRVDLLLNAVARICHERTFGRLDVVGTGPDMPALVALSERLKLGDKCAFHPPVSPDRVRELMRQADIFVLSSDRHEGWGVVANEAMSEGAVLVANNQAGAAPLLIDHGRTGFLFEDGDVDSLAGILLALLANASHREAVRQAAWVEMQRLWHPRVGAERLMRLTNGLLGLAPVPVYQEGPCCRIAGR